MEGDEGGEDGDEGGEGEGEGTWGQGGRVRLNGTGRDRCTGAGVVFLIRRAGAAKRAEQAFARTYS